jgi:hypothetical protein
MTCIKELGGSGSMCGVIIIIIIMGLDSTMPKKGLSIAMEAS